MDNRIIKDYPSAKADVTNSAAIRIPLYLGFVLALIVSFFKPAICLIIVLLVVIVLAVQVFLIIRSAKKPMNQE